MSKLRAHLTPKVPSTGATRITGKVIGVAAGAAAVTATTLFIAAFWGCSTVPDTTYGDPTGLRSANIPGEGGVVIVSACEAGIPKSRAITEAGLEGGLEGGCAISFTYDIYPNMTPSGVWQCAASGCHGGAQVPLFDAGSPEALLSSLRAYSLSGEPYVAPAADGGDPAKSGIYCNLSRTCSDPMPPANPLTGQDLCLLETWLRCGAPSN